MKITTTPASRFGWQGQTVHYTVTAQGGTSVSVPASIGAGTQVRVTDQHAVAGGAQAGVDVTVRDTEFY